MEPRQLLTAAMGTGANAATLYISGTESADSISLTYKGVYLRVRINNTLTQFKKGKINRIEILALGGNDVVDWSTIAINTYCDAGAGDDRVYGGSGNDSMSGSAGKDLLYGGDGDDRLVGGKHNDTIYGQGGNDVLYGDDGNDYVDGGLGKDHLFGVAGDDTLLGQQGNDDIYGGDGTDMLYGGDGNDVISGDAGVDYIYGQAGDDVLNSAGDGSKDIVDAGDGNDTVTSDPKDRVGDAELINGIIPTTPTPTPTGPGNGSAGTVATDGAADLAVGDEALWPANFSTTVAQLRSLGVKTVRLYLNVNNYDERPAASDTIDYSALAEAWRPGSTATRPVVGGLAMQRAFDLKAAGFGVVMTVSEYGGAPPTSAAQVKAFYTYLMNSPETPGSSNLLKNAVDYWEVGNEVDLGGSWTPSATNKTTGLQAYVDQLLEPAADVLHAGGEKVVSSSVSFSANDLNTIIQEIKKDDFLSEVDALGFHPYGRYLPDQNINEIADRAAQAKKFAAAVNRPLIATEWNVRGYAQDGSNDAAWTSAINTIYETVIKEDFALNFYYTIVNDYVTRGGNPSARPAGVLKHDGSATANTSSSVSDLLAYYRSPMVPSQPFYSTFSSFNS